MSNIEAFASQLRGEVVLPQDSNYNDTRKVYNAMIDKRPGMIVKCVDVKFCSRPVLILIGQPNISGFQEDGSFHYLCYSKPVFQVAFQFYVS